jgi:hypothetical protein
VKRAKYPQRKITPWSVDWAAPAYLAIVHPSIAVEMPKPLGYDDRDSNPRLYGDIVTLNAGYRFTTPRNT